MDIFTESDMSIHLVDASQLGIETVVSKFHNMSQLSKTLAPKHSI